MPGLALVWQVFCAILQRYGKMQQYSILVPVERDPATLYQKQPILRRFLQVLPQTGSKIERFRYLDFNLKARAVPNPGDVPPLRLGSHVEESPFAPLRDNWSLPRVSGPDSKKNHAKAQWKENGENEPWSHYGRPRDENLSHR